MTIEKLLRVLRPFYYEWGQDDDGWGMHLVAIRSHSTLSVSLRVNADQDPTRYAPGTWILGLDNLPNRATAPVEIASIEVDKEEKVLGITPRVTASYGHVAPLMRAVLAVPEIREVLR